MSETFCNTIQRYPGRFCLISIIICSEALCFGGVYYKYPMMLASKGISEEKSTNNNISVGPYIMPLFVGGILGYYIIGRFFDLISRQLMCFLLCNVCIYIVFMCGVLLIYLNFGNFTIWQLSVYMGVLFFFYAPASSCGNIAASELFSSNTRSLIMATMYSINCLGNIIAIWVDSPVVPGVVMIVVGCLAYIFGVDSENKSLE
jgi:MFS family permease